MRQPRTAQDAEPQPLLRPFGLFCGLAIVVATAMPTPGHAAEKISRELRAALQKAESGSIQAGQPALVPILVRLVGDARAADAATITDVQNRILSHHSGGVLHPKTLFSRHLAFSAEADAAAIYALASDPEVDAIEVATVSRAEFLDGPAMVGSPTANQIFVTSTLGTGDLSTWPQAGGNTGMAAADAVCQAAASDAGLDGAAEFIAWMSDSTDDAYCRTHGLTGTLATNCGQGALPTDAGPWQRVDGKAFSPTAAKLRSGTVFYPTLLNQWGNPVASNQPIWTGTDAEGAFSGEACSDWTASESVRGGTGIASGGSGDWTMFEASSTCFTPRALLCLRAGAGPQIPYPDTSGRYAFKTSVTGAGRLDRWAEADGEIGIAAGDAICQQLAADAGLSFASSYKAWLSDGATHARDRFVHDGPWTRRDRSLIAEDLADLVDGSVLTSLSQDEHGNYAPGYAWTGTNPYGYSTFDNCLGWTDNSGGIHGATGQAGSSSSLWTAEGTPLCFAEKHLYCFADHQPPLFSTGFETGDLEKWTHVID